MKPIEEIVKGEIHDASSVYRELVGMIDLTSLEATDNVNSISDLCDKALNITASGSGIPHVAAVCVYPNMVKFVKNKLLNSGIKIASVAGAFPSGQTSLEIKLAEIKYALDEGADEIDTVLSRGRFLAGEYNFVYDEVAAMKEVCGEHHLKLILETGELKAKDNISKAGEIVLDAGADFLKTSTGKIQPGATEEAFYYMLVTIDKHFKKTGIKSGIKAAGGISTPEIALNYYKLVSAILGADWLNNEHFRIGASRLIDKLIPGKI